MSPAGSPAEPEVEIFTDGACSGNPGPGGWGALLRAGGKERQLSGGEAATTNNRMEMMAAISALEALKRPSTVRLYTDSSYLKDGITRIVNRLEGKPSFPPRRGSPPFPTHPYPRWKHRS